MNAATQPALYPAAAPALTPPSRLPATTVVAAAVFSLFWILLGSLVIGAAREHDFLNLYTGASLARSGKFAVLHDYDTQLNRERELAPRARVLVPFVRPHFYAALLAPLAWLPFSIAFWAWVGVHSAILVGCWVWAARRFGPDALMLGSLYLPTALGIAHGQDCVLMLMIALGAWVALEQERPFHAGAVLALGLAKFHLLLLFPLALVLRRQRRMLAGFVSSAASLAVVGLLLGGRAGLERYIALLRRKDLERLSPSPELMINIHALPANLGWSSTWMSVLLLAVVVGLVVLAVRHAPAWRWFAAAAAGSLLASPHVYGYDAGLLLLPLWLALFCSQARWTRLAATAVLIPVPFLVGLAGPPWSVLPAVLLLLFLVSLALESRRPTEMVQEPFIAFGRG